MMSENFKQLLEIVTPCCLFALFIINLMQTRDQQKNKIDLLDQQARVKEDLWRFNGQVKKSIDGVIETVTQLRIEVKEHVARDEEYQRGITRTLGRMDNKLEKL